MVTYAVDTEALIEEVRKRPVIWDSTLTTHVDRFQKRRSWQEVVEALSDDVDDLTNEDKEAIVDSVRKRWKNIRDCFLRELRERRAAKKENRFRKTEYAYFKHLAFLMKTMSTGTDDVSVRHQVESKRKRKRTFIKTEPEIESDPFHREDIDDSASGTDDVVELAECPADQVESKPKRKKLFIKTEPEIQSDPFHREDIDDSEFNEISFGQEVQDESLNEDEDRMFLLSLVSAMKRIPKHDKLATRIKILTLIEEATQGRSYGSSRP